jgi:hexosaminidase
MEARPDDTYRLLDPDDTTELLTVQYYDRRCVRRGACCRYYLATSVGAETNSDWADPGRSLLNPCLDSSWNFVRKVIAAIKAMHDAAGAPLRTWHFGGDEAKVSGANSPMPVLSLMLLRGAHP